MSKHFVTSLKAYASLVGAVATALAAVYTTPILTAVAAVATAVVVWKVPKIEA